MVLYKYIYCMKKQNNKAVFLSILATSLISGIAIVWAWTGPTGNPYSNNVDVPINAGGVNQNKLGGFVPAWLGSTGVNIFSGSTILGRGSGPAAEILDVTGNAKVSGNVGIGTTGPGAKLQVHTAASTIDGLVLSATDSRFIRFAPSPGAGSWNSMVQAGDQAIIFSNGTTGTGNFVIAPWSASNAGLRITSAGNVGIGDANPQALLSTVASANQSQIRASTWADMSGSGAGIAVFGSNVYRGNNDNLFHYSNGHGSIGAGGLAVNWPNWGDATLFASTGATTAGASFTPTAGFVLKASGNVGVGTSTPGSKLTVAGAIQSSTGGFVFPDGSTQTTAAASGQWTTNGTHITNANTGNVSINAGAAPGSKLTVFGSAGVTALQVHGITGTNQLYIDYNGGGMNYIRGNTNAFNGTWYDENNSAYYVDPNNASVFNSLSTNGAIYALGNIVSQNASPTYYFQDTDGRSAMLHNNSNHFYVLNIEVINSTSWVANGGYWPIDIDLTNDNTALGGNVVVPEGNVGIRTGGSALSPYLAVNASGLIGGANQTYDIGAGNIAVGDAIYSYDKICAGNSSGNCEGTGGMVMSTTNIKFPDGTTQSTAAGSGSFIQNQYAAAQTGNLWVSANIKAGALMESQTYHSASTNDSWIGYGGTTNYLRGSTYAFSAIWYDETNVAYYVDPSATSIYNDLRANIFYDQGNTGFYLDPAGTSVTNVSYQSFIYDRDNNGYYLDPNGTSNLNGLNFGTVGCIAGYCPPNGAVRLTPNLHLNANAGYATIINWDNGTLGAGLSLRVGNGAGADAFYVTASGNTTQTGSNSSTIYYDQNNAGYYVDPNGSSNVSVMSMGTAYSSNWFRSYGATGWYSEAYGSGIYADEAGYVRGYGTSGLKMYGSVYAPAFIYNSDRRLKENIVPLQNSLDSIRAMQGYTFNWKDTGRADIGVIAQEVEKVFPNLVHTDSKTGLKSVEYGNLVAPLIEAIKELANKFDALATRVFNVESRQTELEKQNAVQAEQIAQLQKQIAELSQKK